MFEIYKKTIGKLPSHSNKLFWITIALIIKSIFFVFKVSIEERPSPNTYFTQTFANEWGDTYSYIEPIESFISNGVYNGDVYVDYRMPGYVFPYYFLRVLFDVTTSLNILVILQLVAGAISVYLLAMLALNILNRKEAFLLVFSMYAINTFVSLFDSALMSESFCTSSLIFSVYFLLRDGNKNVNLFYAGLFLTWCIFLKPAMALLLIIYGLYVLIDKYEGKISLNWTAAFYFSIVFLVFESAWIIRNFNVHNKFIPLTTSKYYPGTEESYLGPLFEFMNSYGGSVVWWDPNADITFFKPITFKLDRKVETKLPENIYTADFNYDSLLEVRNLIRVVNDTTLNKSERKRSELIAMAKLKRYSKSIEVNKPFMYFVSSRFKVLKNYFFHSGTSTLFTKSSSNLSVGLWGIKVFYSLMYVFVAAGGFIATIYLLLKSKSNLKSFIIAMTGLYIALVFPFLFKMDEYRYFVPGYPFFMLSIIIMIGSIIDGKKNAELQNSFK
jgi:hypothetical protein